jgi:hypothetical protein
MITATNYTNITSSTSTTTSTTNITVNYILNITCSGFPLPQPHVDSPCTWHKFLRNSMNNELEITACTQNDSAKMYTGCGLPAPGAGPSLAQGIKPYELNLRTEQPLLLMAAAW